MSVYPLSFTGLGNIEFRAECRRIQAALQVAFRFEDEPYPSNLDYFDTEALTISGPEDDYSIVIPPPRSEHGVQVHAHVHCRA